MVKDDIRNFIIKNPEIFRKCNPNAPSIAWHDIIHEDKEIGYIWFKNILGGWNICLYDHEGQAEYTQLANTVQEIKNLLPHNKFAKPILNPWYLIAWEYILSKFVNK